MKIQEYRLQELDCTPQILAIRRKIYEFSGAGNCLFDFSVAISEIESFVKPIYNELPEFSLARSSGAMRDYAQLPYINSVDRFVMYCIYNNWSVRRLSHNNSIRVIIESSKVINTDLLTREFVLNNEKRTG